MIGLAKPTWFPTAKRPSERLVRQVPVAIAEMEIGQHQPSRWLDRVRLQVVLECVGSGRGKKRAAGELLDSAAFCHDELVVVEKTQLGTGPPVLTLKNRAIPTADRTIIGERVEGFATNRQLDGFVANQVTERRYEARSR